jgi:hypothetical protein
MLYIMKEVTTTRVVPHEMVVLIANLINYLNFSFYEAQFTQTHEEARANINSVYNAISSNPAKAPTRKQCVSLYNEIRVLENVTYTDDPDYFTYKRYLRKYIAELE